MYKNYINIILCKFRFFRNVHCTTSVNVFSRDASAHSAATARWCGCDVQQLSIHKDSKLFSLIISSHEVEELLCLTRFPKLPPDPPDPDPHYL
jgi:hypothetical protein